MTTYAEKLKDPRWQKRRLEILSRDDWACQACGDKTSTLHVHHRFYERGLEPWEAANWALVTLCEDCHELEKENRPALENELIESLKMHYLAQDLNLITKVFLRMPLVTSNETQLEALAEYLSHYDNVDAIVNGFIRKELDRMRPNAAAT